MKNKLCRICWNTDGWRRPSGAIKESSSSFAARLGFGLEEWLFNYEWSIEGYKYGFIQPISRYRKKYEGEYFSAILYTKHEGSTLLVARISNIYVPKLEELKRAFKKMTKHGWVNQMLEDIRRVAGDELDSRVEKNLYQYEGWSPAWSINISFKPSDVTIFDPMPMVDKDHKIARNARYQPFDWEGDQLPPFLNDGTHDPDDRMRDELQRNRAAQQATTIDPQHVRLQNRLFRALKERYPCGSVLYEKDHVDLQVVDDTNGLIFYEIKTDSNAKRCIRNALGQLLEYSSYPPEKRAEKLVVVGDAWATEDDRSYLRHLRETYSLPIYYARFNWHEEDIEQEE